MKRDEVNKLDEMGEIQVLLIKVVRELLKDIERESLKGVPLGFWSLCTETVTLGEPEEKGCL
jgi:hypothetical protein